MSVPPNKIIYKYCCYTMTLYLVLLFFPSFFFCLFLFPFSFLLCFLSFVLFFIRPSSAYKCYINHTLSPTINFSFIQPKFQKLSGTVVAIKTQKRCTLFHTSSLGSQNLYLHHLLVVWLGQATIPLSSPFLIYGMGLILLLTSQSCYKAPRTVSDT